MAMISVLVMSNGRWIGHKSYTTNSVSWARSRHVVALIYNERHSENQQAESPHIDVPGSLFPAAKATGDDDDDDSRETVPFVILSSYKSFFVQVLDHRLRQIHRQPLRFANRRIRESISAIEVVQNGRAAFIGTSEGKVMRYEFREPFRERETAEGSPASTTVTPGQTTTPGGPGGGDEQPKVKEVSLGSDSSRPRNCIYAAIERELQYFKQEVINITKFVPNTHLMLRKITRALDDLTRLGRDAADPLANYMQQTKFDTADVTAMEEQRQTLARLAEGITFHSNPEEKHALGYISGLSSFANLYRNAVSWTTVTKDKRLFDGSVHCKGCRHTLESSEIVWQICRQCAARRDNPNTCIACEVERMNEGGNDNTSHSLNNSNSGGGGGNFIMCSHCYQAKKSWFGMSVVSMCLCDGDRKLLAGLVSNAAAEQGINEGDLVLLDSPDLRVLSKLRNSCIPAYNSVKATTLCGGVAAFVLSPTLVSVLDTNRITDLTTAVACCAYPNDIVSSLHFTDVTPAQRPRSGRNLAAMRAKSAQHDGCWMLMGTRSGSVLFSLLRVTRSRGTGQILHQKGVCSLATGSKLLCAGGFAGACTVFSLPKLTFWVGVTTATVAEPGPETIAAMASPFSDEPQNQQHQQRKTPSPPPTPTTAAFPLQDDYSAAAMLRIQGHDSVPVSSAFFVSTELLTVGCDGTIMRWPLALFRKREVSTANDMLLTSVLPSDPFRRSGMTMLPITSDWSWRGMNRGGEWTPLTLCDELLRHLAHEHAAGSVDVPAVSIMWVPPRLPGTLSLVRAANSSASPASMMRDFTLRLSLQTGADRDIFMVTPVHVRLETKGLTKGSEWGPRNTDNTDRHTFCLEEGEYTHLHFPGLLDAFQKAQAKYGTCELLFSLNICTMSKDAAIQLLDGTTCMALTDAVPLNPKYSDTWVSLGDGDAAAAELKSDIVTLQVVHSDLTAKEIHKISHQGKQHPTHSDEELTEDDNILPFTDDVAGVDDNASPRTVESVQQKPRITFNISMDTMSSALLAGGGAGGGGADGAVGMSDAMTRYKLPTFYVARKKFRLEGML